MQTIKLLILALVQAITEFLPISSSGHLVLAQNYLGIDPTGMSLELFLHFGTLISVCVFYRKKLQTLICGIFRAEGTAWKYALWVLISMIPAGVTYAIIGDKIENNPTPRMVSIAILLNGVMLLMTIPIERLRNVYANADSSRSSLSPLRALAMGIGQAIAMIPGISRSGTSINFGRLSKVSARDAAEFSFIMSIPVIAGASLKDILKSWNTSHSIVEGISIGDALLSTAVAAVIGYLALKLLVRILDRGRFWFFGIYCLVIGALSLIIG